MNTQRMKFSKSYDPIKQTHTGAKQTYIQKYFSCKIQITVGIYNKEFLIDRESQELCFCCCIIIARK